MISYGQRPRDYFPTLVFVTVIHIKNDSRIKKKQPMFLGFLKCLKARSQFLYVSEISGCGQNPCHNEGTCISQGEGYKCTCLQGFTDDHCETGSISHVLFSLEN